MSEISLRTDQYRQVLRARGVPEALIEPMATRHEGRALISGLSSMRGAFVFGLLGYVALVVVWPHLMRLYVSARGLDTGALMFFYSDLQLLGLAFLLIPLICWSYAGYLKRQAVLLPHPAANDLISRLRILTPIETVTKPARAVAGVRNATTEVEAVAAIARNHRQKLRYVMIGGVVMTLIWGVIFHDYYWVITPTEVRMSGFGKSETYALSDITHIEVGCVSGASPMLIYRLHLGTQTLNLMDAQANRSDTILAAEMKAVALRLKALNIPNVVSPVGFEDRCREAWGTRVGVQVR